MAGKTEISTKRVAISKANAQMVTIVGVAAFVTIFCLFASKAVFSQNRYQARLTSAKEKAHQQLVENIQTFSSLQKSYNKFNSADPNVIGGSAAGNSGTNDGTNSTIILDALPYSYDFPALTSTMEKILSDGNLKVSSLTGTDDQINQQNNVASPNPQPVPMDFAFTVNDANYASIAQMINQLQQSIRPIQIDSLDISGGANNMTATVDAHTYYQPIKSVSITKKVIK